MQKCVSTPFVQLTTWYSFLTHEAIRIPTARDDLVGGGGGFKKRVIFQKQRKKSDL